MIQHMHERSGTASPAAVAGQGAEPAYRLLSARGARMWLAAIPLALIATAAFLPALDNGFGPGARSGSGFTNRWPGCSSRCNMCCGNSTLALTT
jgi:hypothetical protein